MAKLLLSWMGYINDFVKDEKGNSLKEVSELGPNYTFHQYFYSNENYDEHIILYTAQKDENWAVLLLNKLLTTFPNRSIESCCLNINDPINLHEVKGKIESYLLSKKDRDIDIFFSPGASMIQVSWFLCHQSLNLKTRLLQTRPGRFSSKKDNMPELLEIQVDRSATPVSAVIKEDTILQREKGKSDYDGDYVLAPSIKPVYRNALLISQTDHVTTLIRGATGTGKEHLAEFIHKHSPRKNNIYLSVNCAAYSDELLGSELFGHEKGSFTGAVAKHAGIFEQASGGTVFLDEIGDISSFMQQSLLRVLQNKTITPIGGTPKKVNVRVIAATNCNLEKMCTEGDFRWDLFYRLAVAELELPSLQERGPQEVEQLLDHFISVKRSLYGRAHTLKLSKKAKEHILSYPFPGNVRELENLVDTLYVFNEREVEYVDLPHRIRQPKSEYSLKLEDVEKEHIIKVLHLKKGNKRQTAFALDCTEKTLSNLLKKYKLLESTVFDS
ncbi:sigma-54 dependent transcriptional regulator [Rhodocytophaga aerolata]|uniref:Sigma-54 dependent transcriptional regulator n=1 Tax=Rhodocytophaga aerolata TaxID=455078 RepID=A0ABT8RI55_9BACT|nr:sigma-54 dependent transcriptional regulator [Rhodocytophaga aerolata]MDO1450357.1 sigma-54 dependent transcriptional regulator [Rhodocytophaga aerolata]